SPARGQVPHESGPPLPRGAATGHPRRLAGSGPAGGYVRARVRRPLRRLTRSSAMPYLVADDLPQASAGQRFRALLQRPGILQLPGAHNGLASLQAKQAGFDAVYISGGAVTASMGLPDLGVITVDEMAFFVRQVARA